MEQYTEQEYLQAKQKVEELSGFYWNLASYIIIIAMLFGLDYYRDKQIDWAYWPMFGWGIGITFHAIKTFGFFNSKDWEEKKINEIMEKNRKQKQHLNH